MGACFEDDKKRNNTWGSKNQNQKENGEQSKENINNNDHNYIMQKRAEFFQSDNFKKKQIFNNE